MSSHSVWSSRAIIFFRGWFLFLNSHILKLIPTISEVRLSLIGMSGAENLIGRMQSQGYRSIICDNLIAGNWDLTVLEKYFGTGAWMENLINRIQEAQQIWMETKVVTQICDELERSSVRYKVIIDTTGSLIYTSLNSSRSKNYFLVYLRLGKQQPKPFTNFYWRSKPVIWGKHYSPEPGEKPKTSLRCCYRRSFRPGIA